jgi:hypothetical protein
MCWWGAGEAGAAAEAGGNVGGHPAVLLPQGAGPRSLIFPCVTSYASHRLDAYA